MVVQLLKRENSLGIGQGDRIRAASSFVVYSMENATCSGDVAV